MVQTPAKTLTLTEFLQQPETKPAREYIDGQIIQKPMPQGQHSTLQGELVMAINAVTKSSHLAWIIRETVNQGSPFPYLRESR
jgi:Uma2 family endonuclease